MTSRLSARRKNGNRLILIEGVPPYAVVSLIEQLSALAQKHSHVIADEVTCSIEVELDGNEPQAFKRLNAELFERGIIMEEVRE